MNRSCKSRIRNLLSEKEVGQSCRACSGRPSRVESISGRRDRYAMDHFCDSLDLVASGIGERLHDGRSCSCPSGHCYHRLSDPAYSGTTNTVMILTPCGRRRGVWKEGGRQVREEFASGAASLAEKVLQSIIFTVNFTKKE